MTGPAGPPYPAPLPPSGEVCAFHSDRPTSLHCTRCGRPACPQCLTPASVGFHCRACVAEARGSQRVARSVAGARVHPRPPVATYALIAINVIVFAITSYQAKSLSGPGNAPIFEQGAMTPDLVVAGQWWRLLTNGFLHIGLTHIALNMVSLYLLGVPVERVFGPARYLVVYFLALFGSSVAELLLSASLSSSAGASGAIFGLMGALVVTFRRLRLDPRQLWILLAANLVFTFVVPGISWQGHIGGLLFGAAAGAIMVYPPQRRRQLVQVAGSIGLLLVMVVVVVGFTATHTAQYCSASGGYFLPC